MGIKQSVMRTSKHLTAPVKNCLISIFIIGSTMAFSQEKKTEYDDAISYFTKGDYKDAEVKFTSILKDKRKMNGKEIADVF